jgi:hypothetical protein
MDNTHYIVTVLSLETVSSFSQQMSVELSDKLKLFRNVVFG